MYIDMMCMGISGVKDPLLHDLLNYVPCLPTWGGGTGAPAKNISLTSQSIWEIVAQKEYCENFLSL